jgi:hypothetical protein
MLINDPRKGGLKDSYGADADVAQEVIKGGYDKKLKTGSKYDSTLYK